MATTVGGIPNRELVVYALYLLGGDSNHVHTEDVAIKCFELFPSSFSWVKHTRFPDKDIVRVALTDARKSKHGTFVSGHVEGKAAKLNDDAEPEGWNLTEQGLVWIRENLSRFGEDPAKHERKAHRQLLLRRVHELTGSLLFRRFEE